MPSRLPWASPMATQIVPLWGTPPSPMAILWRCLKLQDKSSKTLSRALWPTAGLLRKTEGWQEQTIESWVSLASWQRSRPAGAGGSLPGSVKTARAWTSLSTLSLLKGRVVSTSNWSIGRQKVLRLWDFET